MIWDRPKIPKLYLGLTFLIWQLTNLLSLAIRILKLSWTYHFFIKEALHVFWVQRNDLLSQINYHKYLQSMDKSMCQWINQSINKSIYKCPKTPWSKVLIQSKTHAVLLSCLFNAKSIFLHKSCGGFIIFHCELREIQVSSWKNNHSLFFIFGCYTCSEADQCKGHVTARCNFSCNLQCNSTLERC
jgi:hypothetical protein